MLPQPMPPRARRTPGTSEPRGVVPALVLMGFGLTALCGVVALLLWGRLPTPPPTPDLPAVVTDAFPSVTPQATNIQGAVWEDSCDEHHPTTPACVLNSDGRYRANGAWEPGEPGRPGLRVALGLGGCPAAPTLTALTGPDGNYHFGGLPAGTYCIAVDPAEVENTALVPGSWSWPTAGVAMAAQVTVNASSGQTAVVNFGWDRHEQSPSPSPAPTTAAATVIPGCSNYAAFMADVTIPDGSVLPGGAPFTKTWRVLNSGSCAWDNTYGLLFDSGEVMGGPVSVPFTQTIEPGGTLDVSLNMVAPASAGPHTGAWLFRDGAGQPFGTGPNADMPLRLGIVVSGTYVTPAPSGAAATWLAAFYNNVDLSGQPVLTRTETTAGLDHDWGPNAPAPGVAADDFSARWSGVPVLEEGTWRFTITVDDGARLYVDDELVIDEWRDASRREVVVERALAAGPHALRLEYYDQGFEAVAQLRWERTGPYPYWRGEYWANTTLIDQPVLVRQDARLDFSWGLGSPQAGIPPDNFSARWTRTSHFEAGTWRFRVTVDDGARLWVDDQLVIDEWVGGPPREITGTIGLSAGPHSVRVEFVEFAVEARLAVRWEMTTAVPYPDWKAEYFGNNRLEGAPVLVRNDPYPDFNWGLIAPAVGVPAEEFSVRWTKTVTLPAGLYRFHAFADDGVRMSVGPQRIIDEWHDSDGTTEYQAEAALSGAYPIVIEYYDSALTARVRVWWERIGDVP